jgi:MFS family permease
VNSPSSASAALARPWAVLAVTLAIQALVAMAVLTVPAMGPAMAQALGVSATSVGIYVSLVYLGAIVASLASGPLIVRFGAIAVSQAGLLGCAAGLALFASFPSIVTGMLSAVLTGIGYGPITPASSHLLARSTPAHRVSFVFSIKQTGVPLGGVLAGVIVPPVALAGGTNAALLAVAAACAVCALVAQPWRAVLDTDRNPSRPLVLANFAAPIRLVLSQPALARLAGVSFVFSAMQMCLSAYVVTYLHSTLGHSLVAAGVALSAANAGGVAGRVAWGYIADRWLPPARMLSALGVAMAACAASLAAMQVGAPLALVLLLLVAFGASAIGWNGVYLAQVARLAPPGMAGVATGGTLSMTFMGVVVGPPLFGVVSGAFGSHRAGFIALAIPAAFCAWMLARLARRTP